VSLTQVDDLRKDEIVMREAIVVKPEPMQRTEGGRSGIDCSVTDKDDETKR
jgi:hypothetical protein